MPRGFLKHTAVVGLVSLLLIVILSACSTTSGTVSAQSVHVDSSLHDSTLMAPFASTVDEAAGINQNVHPGVQSCPIAVRTNGYWDQLLHTQHGINAVESVTCASMKGDSTLQALVLVRNAGTGHILSVYVYDKLSNSMGSTTPQQLFKLEGLYKGSAKISPYDTIITAEADTLSVANRNKPNIGILPDVYREFKWSASAFIQAIFPGIFPDLTRFQAEADQQQVNQGHQPWKRSAVQAAQALINGIAGPSGQPATTVISGGGTNDVGAVIKVKSTHPGSSWVTVTMTRLEGNTNNIWIVTKVQTDGLSINQPATLTSLSSPIKATGQGVAFEDVIGDLQVQNRLDPGIGVIGRVTVKGKQGLGHTTFSSVVSYSSSAKVSGISAEEGTLSLYSISLADGSVSGMYIIKVLLNS